MRTDPFSKNLPVPVLPGCCANTRGAAAMAVAAAAVFSILRLIGSIFAPPDFQPSNFIWVEGANAVLPPSCGRSRTDIARHSRALLPSFGPDATASTQVICMDSVAPGPGDWRQRQLPGNPGLGGRRHL